MGEAKWQRMVLHDPKGKTRFVVFRVVGSWLDVWSGTLGKAGGVRSREIGGADAVLRVETEKYVTRGFTPVSDAAKVVSSLPALSAKERERAMQTLTRGEPPMKKLTAAREAGSTSTVVSRKLLALSFDPNPKRVRKLLDEGADPNYRNKDGDSCFFGFISWALDAGDDDALGHLDALADAGLRVEQPVFEDGGGALHAIIGEPDGNVDVRRRLLAWLVAKGCDPSRADDEGRTPLHMWASSGPTEASFLSALLDAGARLDALDAAGRTPIHHAFPNPNEFRSAGADATSEARAEWLIKAGARVDIRCAAGQSVRVLAKRQRRLGRAWENVEKLLDAINAPGAAEEWEELLEVLPKLKRPERLRRAPDNLSDAVAQGDLRTVERFLEDGVDPNVGWREGYFPIQRALAKQDPKLIALLKRYGAMDREAPKTVEGAKGLGRLIRGVAAAETRRANRGVVRKSDERKSLLARAAALIARDPYDAAHVRLDNGVPALLFACRNGLDSIVELFLDAGVEPNGRSMNQRAQPLIAAAHGGPRELVERLLKKGADPNLSSSGGEFAIRAAAQSGDAEIVRLLLEAGADPMACEAGASTSIASASGPDRNAVRRMLREAARPAVEKSRASPLKFRSRKHMYDASALVGVCEFDAYYPAAVFGVVAAPVNAVIDAVDALEGIEEHRHGTGGTLIPAMERSIFVFSTTAKPSWTIFAKAMLPHGRLARCVEAVAEHLDTVHFLRTYRAENRWNPPGPEDPETRFFQNAGLWVPPFYVSGEGMYDRGDQHMLEFKGIKKGAIHRADYLVLKAAKR